VYQGNTSSLKSGVSAEQQQRPQSAQANPADTAFHMDQTLRLLRIYNDKSSWGEDFGFNMGSAAYEHRHGASTSPVTTLFRDDKQLQAFEEQSDDVVLQQLMQWTAQLLQRMLKATEHATLEARGELKAAVKDLVEERAQYVPHRCSTPWFDRVGLNLEHVCIRLSPLNEGSNIYYTVGQQNWNL
jgi:hypothetical protein